jgi:tRNA pseudouridine55 synthase
MDGLLIIDKPAGPTSHDVVARVRRVLGERRIGHTGTLDPAASGVLPLVIGRATRLAQFLSAADKSYEVTITLGIETDTYDGLGQPVGTPYAGAIPTRPDIEGALDEFRGTFLQRPPAYSAKKVGGRRSYKIARASARDAAARAPAPLTPPALVSPAPVPVTVHAIEWVGMEGNRVALRVTCGAGFYVRSLAHDLGERLGTGAHLSALRRTQSGETSIADAVPLATVEQDRESAVKALVPLAGMLLQLTSVVLTDEGVRYAMHGRDLGPGVLLSVPAGPPLASSMTRLLDRRGELVGLGERAGASGFLHPCVVLV